MNVGKERGEKIKKIINTEIYVRCADNKPAAAAAGLGRSSAEFSFFLSFFLLFSFFFLFYRLAAFYRIIWHAAPPSSFHLCVSTCQKCKSESGCGKAFFWGFFGACGSPSRIFTDKNRVNGRIMLMAKQRRARTLTALPFLIVLM